MPFEPTTPPPAMTPQNAAQRIIEKFGGQVALGRLIGKGQSTVQYWTTTGRIPAKWQGKLLRLARENDVQLVAADFIADEGPENSQRATCPMTAERMRGVFQFLAWQYGTEDGPPPHENAPSRSETATALRHALARLAALDAAREALGIVAAEIKRISAQHARDPAHPDGNVSNLEMTSRECRAILAAYAELGGPTDA
jgi:hypothetical protein